MANVDPGKRQVVADIIRRLHDGLDVEEAKSEILRTVGKLTSAEITGIEQGLIDEGVSPDEIRLSPQCIRELRDTQSRLDRFIEVMAAASA